ncbi:hypothetical protein QBC39DRAFT_329265 [Podospora conica]|nr:hypothetical protein QBC39DRAFT_329265 [Schizothecium conicum]
MLRRRSIKPKPDLHRRKSTSSVHSVHLEHIDQAMAQRDAQAAAVKAFALAEGRAAAANMPLFPPTPPTPESSPRRRLADTSCDESADSLRRRHSVRFVGPCSSYLQANTDRDSGASSAQDRQHGGIDSSEHGDNDENSLANAFQPNTMGLQPPIRPLRPPRRPPRNPPPLAPLPGLAATYMDALKAGDEFYTPEDDIASAPSSYRRLRKSRSLFTSEDTPTRPSQDGRSPFRGVPSPASQPRRFLHSSSRVGTPVNVTPSLRTPRSMNFLRNRRILTGSRASKESLRAGSLDQHWSRPDEKPLATAKSSPLLKNKASTLLDPKPKRSEPAMRKSLRSRPSADDDEGPLPSLPVVKDGGSFKVKARKASQSIKTKLKSLFNLSRSEEQPRSLPTQHIESQRTHVSGGFSSIMSSGSSQEPPVVAEWGSFHRVPSAFPLLHSGAPKLYHSNAGSMDNLRTEQERKVSDDRSLTSWAHSGPSTLTSQQQQEWSEWERQRLSIIGETGTHAPSPSMRRPPLATHLLQHREDDTEEWSQPAHKPDGQRIYSALMKRVQGIHGKNTEIINEQERTSEAEEEKPQACARGRYEFCDDDTPRTIRNCASHRDLCFSSHPFDTPTRPSKTGGHGEGLGEQMRQRSSSFSAALMAAETRPGSAPIKSGGRKFAVAPVQGTRLNFNTVAGDSADPFTSDIAEGTQSAGRQESPAERPSAFFGSPKSHLFRTTSPYRRALKQTIDEDRETRKRQISTATHSSSEGGTQIHIVPPESVSEVPDDINDAYYSESVYSDDGDASGKGYLDLASPPAIGANHRPAGYCGSSSDTSVDWKTWLSANMAKIELSPGSSQATDVEYALPAMPQSFPGGHVREEAQICEDTDDGFHSPEPPTHKPTLPTSPLATVEQNVLKLSPHQRSAKHSTPPAYRPPLHENNSPSSAPPIPLKSSLRDAPSRLRRAEPNTSRTYSPGLSSSPGLSAAIQKQFGPVVPRQSGRGGGREISVASDESQEGERGYFETHDDDLPAFI